MCSEARIAHAVQISWPRMSSLQLAVVVVCSNHCHFFVFFKFDGEQVGCDWALHSSSSLQACEADIKNNL